MKKYLLTLLILFMCIFTCTSCFDKEGSKKYNTKNDFNINLIKATLSTDKNYLISPYSIEMALKMLDEGASGNTKKQIEKVLPERKISDVSVKNRINIANALFIKDKYKSVIKKDFKIALVDKYDSEILYDEFKTPDVINNWVNNKTDGMIKKILNDIEDDFVLGLANAIAIDVDWAKQFECTDTKKDIFTKENGKKINVEMMHNSYTSSDYKYLKTKDATGIIIPYQSYDPITGKTDYVRSFAGIFPYDNPQYIIYVSINPHYLFLTLSVIITHLF